MLPGLLPDYLVSVAERIFVKSGYKKSLLLFIMGLQNQP
jgi:hypothetical protein